MSSPDKVSTFPPVPARTSVQTLQVNLGYRCNQACHHCHVNAGPKRTEMMDSATAQLVMDYLRQSDIKTLDLTGGAPELNPHFETLVRFARACGIDVIDRCNLTVLNEPGCTGLADFLAENHVHVMASVPCYSPENVDKQRGKGVFEQSLRGLRALNKRGYAMPGSGLKLDFVYNPVGAVLPPEAASLERDYREAFAILDIHFNQLLTITNMPINRFASALERDGELDNYMQLLINNYSAANLEHVMCRSLLSVDWQGFIYDCDFNQMLGMPAGGRQQHLRDVLGNGLHTTDIATDMHCYACCAGHGSSCGGSLTAAALPA